MSDKFLKTIDVEYDIKERWLRANDYLCQLEKKYSDLVWYARSDKQNLLEREQYEILSTISKIEKTYKDEVSDLSGKSGDWNHGFNSGMLAAIRLVTGLMDKKLVEYEEDDNEGVELTIIDGIPYFEYDSFDDSIEDFPFLDT